MRSHRALKTHLTLNARGKVHRVPDSSILFHHSWISSSQSFQKETRRAYQMMMLLFFFVSTDLGSRHRGTNNSAWNSSRFTTPFRNFARSNADQHVSWPQPNDRGIVTAGKPISPNHITGQNSNLGLSVSVCIQLCQVLT